MADIFARVPLTALKVFVAASEHRTFTAAAASLGVTQAAVSRQVAHLESLLSTRLFLRNHRRLTLTHEGRHLARELAPHFAAMAETLGDVLDERRDKRVNLRVYPTFADRWLLPRVAAFEAEHPDVAIHFDMTVEPLDFRSTSLDCAVQLGDGRWSGTRSRLLFEDRMLPVCSPGYLTPFADAPDTMLVEGRILSSHYRRRDWAEWTAHTGLEAGGGARMMFASSAMAYRAATCGLGLAIAQEALVADAIRAGDLVTPFPAAPRRGHAFHVVWPTGSAVRAPTRRVVDWLLRQCGQLPAFSVG